MSRTTKRYDVAVVGAGAAGMFAAIAAAERGLSVALFEHSGKTGRKLRITGKGRCNLTNNCTAKEFIENVPGNGRFLYSAINNFTPSDTMAFFESMGIALKTERGRRVFPVSDKASHVAAALEGRLDKLGVSVRHTSVRRIIVNKGAAGAVLTGEGEIGCEAVIVCTGGASYPATGSTGDGYRMASELGHRIIRPRPSLVPLISDDKFCAEMQGFTLKNVSLSVYDDNDRLVFRELGEMMFTHFGVSGPLILSASAHMRNFPIDKYRLSIDLKPGLDKETLDARLLRDFEKYSNRDFRNSLSDLAGRMMIPVLIERSGIPANTKVNSITKRQRGELAELFKNFTISLTAARPIEEAIITSGGVDIKQVNPRTMESKFVSGLYFAGEILDVDAYTGGFNLQIAWSTAYAAGTRVLE